MSIHTAGISNRYTTLDRISNDENLHNYEFLHYPATSEMMQLLNSRLSRCLNWNLIFEARDLAAELALARYHAREGFTTASLLQSSGSRARKAWKLQSEDMVDSFEKW